MYGTLLDALIEDIEAGGPTAAVLHGYEDEPGPSALALRLLGSLHRLVLIGQAPALEQYYPSVGGTWDPATGPRAVIDYFAGHRDAVREWLDFFPQTNEVGRSVALIGGLLQLPPELRAPVRLYELGSSGGLNLLADRFTILATDGTQYGPDTSPVVLRDAWQPNAALTPWPDLRFATAVGSDIHPIDASTPEGAVRLTAYAWPDQAHRLDRLRGALELARQYHPEVHQTSAGDLVDTIEVAERHLTVVWHSVMWQYVPRQEKDRISARLAQLGSTASATAPFVHLRLEPSRRTPDHDHEFLISMTTWPGANTTILGTGAPHGLPATWESSPFSPPE